MKKILIMILSTCLFSVAHAAETWGEALGDVKTSSAEITFKVKVDNKNCTVDSSETQKGIYLGNISKSADTKGPIVPVRFRFRDCKGLQAIQSIRYTADVGLHPNVTPGSPDSGFVSTKFEALKIYLWSNDTGTEKFKEKTFQPNQNIYPNEWVSVCYAQAIVDNDKTSEVGPFDGTAQFTITYQ